MIVDTTFGKSKRLLNAAAFKAVFDKARYKASSKDMLILAIDNGLDHPRIGLVIAKKNIRLAVQRNRIKRIVRESFRLHQQELPTIDIIFLAKRGLAEQDNADIHKELTKTWQRLKKKHQENH